MPGESKCISNRAKVDIVKIHAEAASVTDLVLKVSDDPVRPVVENQ